MNGLRKRAMHRNNHGHLERLYRYLRTEIILGYSVLRIREGEISILENANNFLPRSLIDAPMW